MGHFPRRQVSHFQFLSNGYFGERHGRKHIRNISLDDPLRAADKFAGLIASNPVGVRTIEGKGLVYMMRDGSYITYRYTSTSDGSPVVQLSIVDVKGVKSQKIHFVKRRKS